MAWRIEIRDDYDPGDITDAMADRVCEALGLFGPAAACAERLLRAHAETGLHHVFLFPAHDWATAYHLPRAEVDAFAHTIGPRLEATP